MKSLIAWVFGFSYLKKIYQNRRKPIFVLAGCVAQAESSVVFEKSDYVDIVVGPQAYYK